MYSQELTSVRSGTKMGAISIQELPSKKRAHPFLLGKELDKQVQSSLIALRGRGGVVNRGIILACAEGIVKNHDSNLLAASGGNLVLTSNWGQEPSKTEGVWQETSEHYCQNYCCQF